MSVPTRTSGDRFVLSPREDIVEGGPAEEFERLVQEAFKAGYLHLVTDLRGVHRIDSSGVRALVRGLTTAQRLHGSFSLVGPSSGVRAVLAATHLDAVFPTFEAIEPAVARRWPWKAIVKTLAGAVGIGLLVAVGQWLAPAVSPGDAFPGTGGMDRVSAPAVSPLLELLKLVVAAAIGMLVTVVHRRQRGEHAHSRSMEQAQVLLCVSGAMMMIIIGGSVARAFGIAGAAAIIRFRTPVEDPMDITVLFLLMGLGMSTGLGAFAVAGLGTAFLCVLLVLLDRIRPDMPREMMVEIQADGRDFPTAHVQSVFARNGVVFEPRELSQGKSVAVRYRATLTPQQSLDDLSAQLVAGGGAGIKSVSWEHPKRSE
jgi:anti-anti-sigma factor